MKAIAVTPGKANSVRRVEMSEPRLEDVAASRGVLVRVERLLIHSVRRLQSYEQAFELLEHWRDTIKIVVEVAGAAGGGVR